MTSTTTFPSTFKRRLRILPRTIVADRFHIIPVILFFIHISISLGFFPTSASWKQIIFKFAQNLGPRSSASTQQQQQQTTKSHQLKKNKKNSLQKMNFCKAVVILLLRAPTRPPRTHNREKRAAGEFKEKKNSDAEELTGIKREKNIINKQIKGLSSSPCTYSCERLIESSALGSFNLLFFARDSESPRRLIGSYIFYDYNLKKWLFLKEESKNGGKEKKLAVKGISRITLTRKTVSIST